MITPEQHAAMRRLYYAEHWTVGTIATQLGVHHETVAAALNRASVLTRGGRCRSTALDPYLPFLRDTLAQYPRLRATRLHERAGARRARALPRRGDADADLATTSAGLGLAPDEP